VGVRWLVLVLPVLLGGCFLASWSLERPAPGAVSGPLPYVEECATCHAAPVGEQYAKSRHMALGIRCGQCHTGGNHPDQLMEPVRDAKCGGCHQPQLQQTLASKHFAKRVQSSLDRDRAAQAALRRAGFVTAAAGERTFADGRLCAACHFDEHRLDLGDVQRAEFCVGCHPKRDEHFPEAAGASTNRCVSCHVRVGETVTGQIVNTHRFAIPGSEGGEQ
jgi:hypothetical protein